MPLVSVTRLRLRSSRFLPAFALNLLRTLRQIRTAPGFEGGLVLADRKRTFWTMTAWDGVADMRRYVAGQQHRAAMPLLAGWCDEASVVHWEQGESTLPSWNEADAWMRRHGRSSNVENPSSGHAALDYRPPRTLLTAPVRPTKGRRG